jgi:glutamyl-tRNA reductase
MSMARPTIAVIGVNHRDTPIALRERLSILPAELPRVLALIREVEGVGEVVALSTCNRVELYLAGQAVPGAALPGGDEEVLERTASALCGAKGVELEDVGPSLYRFRGPEAVRHLLEVASGLDSMVPGENEVFAQVKAAYSAAVDAGTAGPEMRRLFQKAFKVAKDVRSRTGISRRKVSVATVVTDLARRVFGRLGEARVVLIGAGEMAGLCLNALVSEGARVAAVANRSLEKASHLTSRYGGEAATLEGAGAEISRADILVASTAAPEPILTAEHVKAAVRARRGRPMLLVDLGVPRNIDEGAADLDGVILYDIDDLQEVVTANMAYRLEQAGQAESLIAEEVRKFGALLKADEVTDTISRLCAELNLIGEDECRLALGRLGGLTEEQQREVSRMAHRIVRKLLHSPISALKEEARGGNGAEMNRWVRRLFGI